MLINKILLKILLVIIQTIFLISFDIKLFLFYYTFLFYPTIRLKAT